MNKARPPAPATAPPAADASTGTQRPDYADHANRTDLPEAAKRALAEAAERRCAASRQAELPPELGGRDGPEPVRYGDWERKGLAVDF
ncbi:DUF1674 domain-containing protein [Brevirhabdus sp.]|uniref:DUF1674 domain-containing protein n=1 Tax=Brevirhabdus sp. TaxID=2004514 RepID=UPI0040589FA1